MFESIGNFFKKMTKSEHKGIVSKDEAKERLHLVLMQDRANVSADFLDLMKQEIIDVIKKYIVVDESSIDVRLTNKANEDGTTGAPALYANIPIINVKNDMKAEKIREFGGVNFSQKLEEVKKQEEKKEKVEETISEMIDEIGDSAEEKAEAKTDVEEKNEKSKSKKSSKKDKKSEKENKSEEIIEEQKENQEDEDDDDVTFDDLLKAAEEEDKKKVSEG